MALRVAIPHEARTLGGRIIPGAKLSIANYSGGGSPTIYTGLSALSGTIPQPITLGQDGMFGGFVDPGRYLVTISYGGESEVHEWAALQCQPDAWTYIGAFDAPAFTNGWAAFSPRRPSYRKTSEGLVQLRGAIASGTLGAAAFTLLTGYRPPSGILAVTASFGTIGRLEVASSGAVSVLAPSSNIYTELTLTFATF